MEKQKVSIRMDKELIKRVENESIKAGVDKSEYIRQAIKEKVEQENSILYIKKLCKISTMYNRIIDKYAVSESEKNEMKEELDTLWRR